MAEQPLTHKEGREIATAILVGLVQHPGVSIHSRYNPEGIDTPEVLASMAVTLADALIKEFEIHQWPNAL